MSRKMLITLIVLMAVVLSGLILVQMSMIKSASDIREEQFDQLVNNILDAVANQMDMDEQRFAIESSRLGFIPGLTTNNDGIDDVFPRNSQGKGLSFSLSYSEQQKNGIYHEEVRVQTLDTTNNQSIVGGIIK